MVATECGKAFVEKKWNIGCAIDDVAILNKS